MPIEFIFQASNFNLKNRQFNNYILDWNSFLKVMESLLAWDTNEKGLVISTLFPEVSLLREHSRVLLKMSTRSRANPRAQ